MSEATPEDLIYVVGVSCSCRYINASKFIGTELAHDGFLVPRVVLDEVTTKMCSLCGSGIDVHWRAPTEEECAEAVPWRDD